MSEPVSLLGDEWEHDASDHRRLPLGPRLGAELLGATLYELPPGQESPYHWEAGCEEWLVVVAGRPTLRDPDGERELVPGDVVAFREGPAGAHQVRNRTDEPVRVLFFSTKAPVAVVVYPDEDALRIWAPGVVDGRLRPA